MRSSPPQNISVSKYQSTESACFETGNQVIEKTDFTFPPEKRLLCRDQFTAVFSKADHRFRQEKLQLLALRQNLGVSRLGLVIPKKMLKKAVHRNRLKRIIRDTFRRKLWVAPCDIVISLKQKIEPESLYQQDIHDVVNDMFKRLERYCRRKESLKPVDKT